MDSVLNFIQQLINGMHIGSIYALIALGYTIVYGIVKLINFAHGDIMMMGAYFAFIALATLGLPLWGAILFSMALSAVFGVVIEKVAYKPLRNAPRIWALISAIGVSFFLENLFLLIFKPDPRPFPPFKILPIKIASLQISGITVVTLLLSFFIMLLLDLFIKKSRTGKAMRATSEDKGAAALMGISVNRTISITFAIGSALGALGGILFALAYPQIDPYMGVMPGLKAFVAAVLGGIGIMPGAMLGGFLLGIAESLTKGYLSTRWADAVVFGILIVVLLVKPSGILGKNRREKV